jgi:hypothetical protein
MMELTDMRDATAHRLVSKPVFIAKMIYQVMRRNFLKKENDAEPNQFINHRIRSFQIHVHQNEKSIF